MNGHRASGLQCWRWAVWAGLDKELWQRDDEKHAELVAGGRLQQDGRDSSGGVTGCWGVLTING